LWRDAFSKKRRWGIMEGGAAEAVATPRLLREIGDSRIGKL
jgi:hypothetical protein